MRKVQKAVLISSAAAICGLLGAFLHGHREQEALEGLLVSRWVSPRPGWASAGLAHMLSAQPELEGSNEMASEPWVRDDAMRRRAGWDVGETGWGSGPDYYSTRKYDNLLVYPPSGGTGAFRPYTGAQPVGEGMKTVDGIYVFSVNARCDLSKSTTNVKKVFLDAAANDPFVGSPFENERYEDLIWPEQQLQLLPFFFRHLTILIPPCFFPNLSNKAMAKLDELVFTRGNNLLIVGGHSGADFISRFLAGEDGHGYVTSLHRDQLSLPKSRMDVVWTNGPFFLQEAAVTSDFFCGTRILRNVEGDCGGGSIVGVPVTDLPANTIHYYMDDRENSVVFEIPAGSGRVLFFGYDMCCIDSTMGQEWAQTLQLAQDELSGLKRWPSCKEAPHLPRSQPPASPPTPSGRKPEMPQGLNYYCAIFKNLREKGASPSTLEKYLEKCKGQDCNHNRLVDQSRGDDLAACKWTDENGFCWLKAAASFCEEFPADDRCYCEDCGKAPTYLYDPTCGKGLH